MTDPKLEQQAAVMLAIEYERDGEGSSCHAILRGEANKEDLRAIRAIVAALNQRDALVAEYERACGIKGEGYVHALMHIFNAITNAQVDAKVAALSQQRTGVPNDLAVWMIENLLNESQLAVIPPGYNKALRYIPLAGTAVAEAPVGDAVKCCKLGRDWVEVTGLTEQDTLVLHGRRVRLVPVGEEKDSE